METLTGALRLFVDGVVNAFDLERLLDTEIETHHEEASIFPTAVTKMADAFPALGIVAAVLGIIITMQHLDGPPSEIGHHVAAALVGTMLGVFGAYGLIGPVATKMGADIEAEGRYLSAIKAAMISLQRGAPPLVCVEFARRTIMPEERPTFEEMDKATKEIKKAA